MEHMTDIYAGLAPATLGDSVGVDSMVSELQKENKGRESAGN